MLIAQTTRSSPCVEQSRYFRIRCDLAPSLTPVAIPLNLDHHFPAFFSFLYFKMCLPIVSTTEPHGIDYSKNVLFLKYRQQVGLDIWPNSSSHVPASEVALRYNGNVSVSCPNRLHPLHALIIRELHPQFKRYFQTDPRLPIRELLKQKSVFQRFLTLELDLIFLY